VPPSESVRRHPFDTACLAGPASEWTADNWTRSRGHGPVFDMASRHRYAPYAAVEDPLRHSVHADGVKSVIRSGRPMRWAAQMANAPAS